MSNLLALLNRTVRHVAPVRSKERYYPPNRWNDSWSHGYDLNNAHEDARYGTLIALIRRHEGNGPLLDVGCGDGLLEEQYRKVSSVQIVAFDYSAAAIDRAKARRLPDVDFFCADSRTFRPQQRFSVVLLNESLYYVEEYLGMMENLSQALTADGVFVVSMHDARITRRIWKNVQRSYTLLHGVTLKDEPTGCSWHIRLLRPRITHWVGALVDPPLDKPGLSAIRK
jgi:SAM-dependent methyltransferase